MSETVYSVRILSTTFLQALSKPSLHGTVPLLWLNNVIRVVHLIKSGKDGGDCNTAGPFNKSVTQSADVKTTPFRQGSV